MQQDVVKVVSGSMSESIRPATAAEFPQLLALQIDCIRGLTDVYGAEEISNWAAYLEREGAERYAKYQNRVAGSDTGTIDAFVSWSEDTVEHVAAIECLYIREGQRGLGLGALLLHAAEVAILTGSTIYVRSTLNARAFYERHGYVYTGDAISRAGFAIALFEKQKPLQ